MSARFIFGASAIYLLVMLADRAAGLFLTPMITRMLTPRDYGVMLLVANGAALINLLFGFVLGGTIPTLFTSVGSDAERRSTCTTIMASITTVLGVLYLAVALFAGPISQYFLKTDEYEAAIALGALWSFLNACALCLVLIVRSAEQHKLYPLVQLPTLALQFVLIVGLVLSARLTVATMYIAMAVAGLFAVTGYVIALRHWLSGQLNSQHLVKGARMGAQMLPWQIASLLTMNSAAFFLTRAGHLDEAGLFALANSAAALLMAASTSFENVWTPFVLLRKDQPDLAQTQIRIMSLYSSGLLLAASALGLFAHEVFAILAGPAFRQGYHFVPALVFAYCIYCFATCFAQGLLARQRTGHYVWIGFSASAIFLAVAVLSTGRFGTYGIIAAMAAGFLTMLISLQLVSGRLMPVAYPWLRHAAMWLIAVVVVVLVYPLEIGWQGLAVKLAALAAIACLPFLFGAIRVLDVRLAASSVFTTGR